MLAGRRLAMLLSLAAARPRGRHPNGAGRDGSDGRNRAGCRRAAGTARQWYFCSAAGTNQSPSETPNNLYGLVLRKRGAIKSN